MFGLIIFGFGEGLLIISTIGASPWNVLHQGLALNLRFVSWNMGFSSKFNSFIALVFFR